jgi:hypothetical protein
MFQAKVPMEQKTWRRIARSRHAGEGMREEWVGNEMGWVVETRQPLYTR